MRHFFRALATYFSSVLTWRSAWSVAEKQRFHTVERVGFIYIEPTAQR